MLSRICSLGNNEMGKKEISDIQLQKSEYPLQQVGIGNSQVVRIVVSKAILRPRLAQVYHRVFEGIFPRGLGENTSVIQNTLLHHKPLPHQYFSLIYLFGTRGLPRGVSQYKPDVRSNIIVCNSLTRVLGTILTAASNMLMQSPTIGFESIDLRVHK
jgi:hypothetical protein